jgi:carbonic anhydrase/acetyltransferase-like protein (isoleucine patch superfamily)
MDDLLVSGPDGRGRVYAAPGRGRRNRTDTAARGIDAGGVPYSPEMPIYRLGDLIPQIHAEAFVHPEAVLIGDVTVGSESTVWPEAVLRGDYGKIVIGERSSVQDGTVIHAGPGFPTIVGDGCVIGHLAHLEGCTVEDDALVGSGSVVLHWAVVGTGATVGANAVVPNRMEVPPGALAIGVPAQIRPDKSDLRMIQMSADEYVANGHRYRQSLERLD